MRKFLTERVIKLFFKQDLKAFRGASKDFKLHQPSENVSFIDVFDYIRYLKFGFTKSQEYYLIDVQNRRCAICQRPYYAHYGERCYPAPHDRWSTPPESEPVWDEPYWKKRYLSHRNHLSLLRKHGIDLSEGVRSMRRYGRTTDYPRYENLQTDEGDRERTDFYNQRFRPSFDPSLSDIMSYEEEEI